MVENEILINLYVVAIAIGLLFAIVLSAIFRLNDMIDELGEAMEKSIALQSEWLFNQLYSIAPGKVLKPDEIEPESSDVVASVYKPSKDGMSEFTGHKEDWHE